MDNIPEYRGTLRSHLLDIPRIINQCSGIRIFGRKIRSLVFSTDVAIISVADVPVFAGVGGGTTNGARSVRLAAYAEHQGAYGVVVNAPIADETIFQIKRVVDIPVIATIVSLEMDISRRIASGADILNVSGAAKTPEIVSAIRKDFPNIPIIATGGPTDEDIARTIQAGANAITYTPPTNGALFAKMMRDYRARFDPKPDSST